MKKRSYLMMGVLLGLCGCAGPGADLPPLPPPTSTALYRLGPGDRVRVLVYGDKELSDVFAIGDDGLIALPLAGSVAASGITASALSTEIADSLKRRGMMDDPSVAVEIASYRPIFILGEVLRPGQYPYEPGMTVVAAVSLAGGYTYRAIKAYESIVRTTKATTVQGRVAPADRVAPGDVITVYDRRF